MMTEILELFFFKLAIISILIHISIKPESTNFVIDFEGAEPERQKQLEKFLYLNYVTDFFFGGGVKSSGGIDTKE